MIKKYSLIVLLILNFCEYSFCSNTKWIRENGTNEYLLTYNNEPIEPSDQCVKKSEKFPDEFKWQCYTHCAYIGYGVGWCFKKGDSDEMECKCEGSGYYTRNSYRREWENKKYKKAGGHEDDQHHENDQSDGHTSHVSQDMDHVEEDAHEDQNDQIGHYDDAAEEHTEEEDGDNGEYYDQDYDENDHEGYDEEHTQDNSHDFEENDKTIPFYNPK
ncbi:glutamic acid-rich protein-like [Ctenocephalides felis]|uniref:glutamic acid-rich protein-like n=1 Tax=Ctenocephalides felis TaxID=7515 RepID=UPI000E6E5A1E|nr:glutamic acid-rich protein-like [Ctenocephalides felis]